MAKGENHIASCPPFDRVKRREYIRGEKSPHRILVPSGKLSLMSNTTIVMKGPAEPDQGGQSELVWDGVFTEKTFWPDYIFSAGDPDIRFFAVPSYGRPVQTFDDTINALHVGNGDLLSLETSPLRGGNYSVKATIKNSANGTEPDDCDPTAGGNCNLRRSQIQLQSSFSDILVAETERWLSLSVFMPSDFNLLGGAGSFDLVVWGSKPNGNSTSGWLGILAKNGGWYITHRFNDGLNTGSWWQNVQYNSTDKPRSNLYASALVDFPDETASRTALGNLNLGGWTDFIIHWKTDTSAFETNTGFLEVYMRADSGSWVQILDILPIEDFASDPAWITTMPERLYDRGVGLQMPDGTSSNFGVYAHKNDVWGRASNLVLHFGNHKVGDANATFSQMTHDGSSL